jgi:hypothetical protein
MSKIRHTAHGLRAAIEISGIIFLFYSNLLMGEFNAGSRPGKTLSMALHDIFTRKNFAIAVVTASFGYAVFDFLRWRLQQSERDDS